MIEQYFQFKFWAEIIGFVIGGLSLVSALIIVVYEKYKK